MNITQRWIIAAALLLGATLARGADAPVIKFTDTGDAPGAFPAKWICGSVSLMDNQDPPVQVHWYNEHTAILRENRAYNHEAVFMYLYFGNDKVLMIDQGSTARRDLWPLRDVVDKVIAEWCARNGKKDVKLICTQSHMHGDHYSGFAQFIGRPNTLLVGLSFEERMSFYGIKNHPAEQVKYDLGGRVVWVWGNPGHEVAELAYYDTYSGFLHTGDMFYRGRCYVRDTRAWVASMGRLVKFSEDHHVSHIVNCHIEIDTKGNDYPRHVGYQPDEPPVQMTVAMLKAAYEVGKTMRESRIYPSDGVYLYNQMDFSGTLEENPYAY